MSFRRIGLILPHIVTNVDRELISGIFTGLHNYGYDLVIITGISNYSAEKRNEAYALGAENIFSLIQKGDFAGFLFAADWFVDHSLKEKIYKSLIERNLPCLVLEEENPYFPYIFPEQRESTYQITSHLIQKHNCHKLYFLAGFEGHRASDERLAGFCRALEENDLPFCEDNVFYGDFWIEKPAELGRKIASGEITMPDAVICACDTMAISLMNTLTENGIRVPEDVKITGNDGKLESMLNMPSLTTICGRNKTLGETAAEHICRMISPELLANNFNPSTEQIVYRKSCGCKKSNHITHDMISEIRRSTAFQAERYVAMTTDFIDKIVGNDTLEDLMFMVASYSYRLPNWKGLAICLCEDWHFDFSDPIRFRRSGFTDNMKIALEMDKIGGFCHICKSDMPVSQLIPDAIAADQPKAWLMTSIHCGGQIFGYICTGYAHPDDIFLDENYCTWCDTIAKGLSETETKLYQRFVQDQISANFDHDPETGFYSRRGLIRKASDFLRDYDNAFIMAVVSDSEGVSEGQPDFDSMLSVAIKKTSVQGEIAARISDNQFILLIPNFEKQPKNRLMYKRLDEIEIDLQHYNTSKLHLNIPIIAVSTSNLFEASDIEALIDQNISAAINYLDDSNSDYSRQFLNIRHRMKECVEKQWNITSLADEMHISRSHFQRLYHEMFGTSFTDDMISIRIEKAKLMLLYSDLQVFEIADALGYNNVSHFMHQFKTKCGVTALQFRNQNRK